MPASIARYLPFTAVQGGADAFVEAAITTDLNPAQGYAYQVTLIEVSWVETNQETWASDFTMQMVLSRDTKTAIAELNDPDVMWKEAVWLQFTTSGVQLVPSKFEYRPPLGLYIVEPTIYFDLDSTTTGVANTVHGRIWYEEVKLSEVEILRLLNNA